MLRRLLNTISTIRPLINKEHPALKRSVRCTIKERQQPENEKSKVGDDERNLEEKKNLGDANKQRFL